MYPQKYNFPDNCVCVRDWNRQNVGMFADGRYVCVFPPPAKILGLFQRLAVDIMQHIILVVRSESRILNDLKFTSDQQSLSKNPTFPLRAALY